MTLGWKFSNLKVLEAVLEKLHIQLDNFAAVCVIIDKFDKLLRKEIESELGRVGVPSEAIVGILQTLTAQSFDVLEGVQIVVQWQNWNNFFA